LLKKSLRNKKIKPLIEIRGFYIKKIIKMPNNLEQVIYYYIIKKQKVY